MKSCEKSLNFFFFQKLSDPMAATHFRKTLPLHHHKNKPKLLYFHRDSSKSHLCRSHHSKTTTPLMEPSPTATQQVMGSSSRRKATWKTKALKIWRHKWYRAAIPIHHRRVNRFQYLILPMRMVSGLKGTICRHRHRYHQVWTHALISSTHLTTQFDFNHYSEIRKSLELIARTQPVPASFQSQYGTGQYNTGQYNAGQYNSGAYNQNRDGYQQAGLPQPFQQPAGFTKYGWR